MSKEKKKLKRPEVFYLNYKRWVCGQSGVNNGVNRLGLGDSMLLNKEGYMCCLGQYSEQCKIDKKALIGTACPDNINIDGPIPGLTVKDEDGNGFGFRNTKLAELAMEINDDNYTTVAEKIKKLKSLFSKNHIKLKLMNFPKKILAELAALGVETI
jgi:hypothetical protein